MTRPCPPAGWWNFLALLSCFSIAGLSGCEGIGNDHPYTPFGTATKRTAPIDEAIPLLDPQPELTPRSIPYEAQVAPRQSRRWTLAGRSIVAPEGLVFRLGLTGALEGGDEKDVLAWAVGTPATPSNGELWLYPASSKPRRIASFPGFVPAGPGCNHGTRLTRTGPSTITLDVLATCRTSLLPRSPVRSLTVLAPLRSSPFVTAFRVAAPASGEQLAVSLDTRDLDSDGRDDITLSIALTNRRTELTAEARFEWIDRAAGLSRNTAEPTQSFQKQAQLIKSAAGRDNSHLAVEQLVDGARRLYASICRESGTPRLFNSEGEGLECGDLHTPFETFAQAAIDSHLQKGRADRALATLEQHSWFPSPARSLSSRFQKRQLKKISSSLSLRRVVKLVPLKARPRSPGSAPRYSPLSFHADGSLLVLSDSGVIRAAPDGRYEYDASEEIDPWPTLVVSSRGERLTGVGFPCDRSEISWLRTSERGEPLAPMPTQLLAPRPGGCGARTSFFLPPVSLIGWNTSGPDAFVGSSRINPNTRRPPLGSALSPNGLHSIVATKWGLLVVGPNKQSLWNFEDPALPQQLKDCVVSNNAQAAACLLTGRAYVVLPDPASG